MKMGMLFYKFGEGGIGGVICYGEGYELILKGVKVYLNGG